MKVFFFSFFFFIVACTSPLSKVFVYKDSGAVQCSKGLSLQEMSAQQLKNMKIFTQCKKTDPNWISRHSFVPDDCSYSTGEINVYEIFKKDLKKTRKLGFTKWGFNSKACP